MTKAPPREKDELRRALRDRRAAIDPAAVRAASARVCAQVRDLPAFGRARLLALYAAIGGEIDPGELHAAALRTRAQLCYPRVVQAIPPTLDFAIVEDPATLRPDRMGIPSPERSSPATPPEALDLVVVPGVAFDPRGNRLGYGRGYYDAALTAAPRALRLGVCHSFQLIDLVPCTDRDQAVDLIVTPDGVRATGARALFAPQEVLS